MKLFNFFFLAGLLLLAHLAPTRAQDQNSNYYLLVGTYTSEASDGIYVYEFDTSSGEASYVSEITEVDNPAYLAVSPDERYVYSVNEFDDDGPSVSSFAFDKSDGTLTFLNKQPSNGGAPCYISVDKTGQAVFAANYLGGSLVMLPVREDGSLAEPKLTIQHEGSSVNEERQESPHLHCTYVAPDNSRVFATDLGTDRVVGYRFHEGEVRLESVSSSVYRAEPGAGPRHLTFHPNGLFAYLVNELNGTVVALRYREGRLDPVQTISMLPAHYEGQILAADIHVSPDGRFLYATNREDLNNIVIYGIDGETGRLNFAGQKPTGGVHPRNFMIDPTGNYLLVANRHTDNIVVFRRDRETGLLTETGTEIEVSQPVCLKMIPVD